MVLSLVVALYLVSCLGNCEAGLIVDGCCAADTARTNSSGEEVTRRCVRWGYDPIQLLFDSHVSRELLVAAAQQRLLDLVKDELLAALRELFTSSKPPERRDSPSARTTANRAARQRLLMDGANARFHNASTSRTDMVRLRARRGLVCTGTRVEQATRTIVAAN